MKEATGELNMTVVTVVAIAAILAFFYLVIWPVIQSGMALSSACSAAGGAAYTQTLDDGATIIDMWLASPYTAFEIAVTAC